MRAADRVLIVDDEPNVRLVFRTALESAGYAVDEAADGGSALDRLRETPPDLVLLDLQMPGEGGMGVLRRLRDAGSDVPVAVVTAHGSVPDAVEAMKLGAVDFVTKPLTPDTLRDLVAAVIRRHAPPPPVDGPAARVVTVGPAAFDLNPVKRAINLRAFGEAERLLEQALDFDPRSAEALTLMGVLQECLGRHHTAYHAYRSALDADANYAPAAENLRRYCERYGLDSRSRAINPAAGPPAHAT